nr:Mrp/NBP35 family ATP-binding protein [Sunxiuqinia sp.]
MNKPNPFEKIDLPGVKNIIVVASGKGGVGKSTVAANLAVALARDGFRTAIFDADLYGPSIPLMFGVQYARPEVAHYQGKETIIPIEKYGVKIISIGFFMVSNKSLIWRGPAASAGLAQLLSDTEWGELDYLIIDFPPGTGDIQLTTIQRLNLSGAILVTTPQQMAVADARKAADMFNTKLIQVPILGVVENMAWFTPEKHPNEKYYLFGNGGGQQLADQLQAPLLVRIPLVCDACELGDTGQTIFASKDRILIGLFENLASQVSQLLATTV